MFRQLSVIFTLRYPVLGLAISTQNAISRGHLGIKASKTRNDSHHIILACIKIAQSCKPRWMVRHQKCSLL
ncbi:hypothetical protein IFVP182_C2120254 [Vibrio parahaemolyticus]